MYSRAVLIVTLALALAGCAVGASKAPEVRIGGGAIEARSWAVIASSSGGNGVCLVVRVTGDDDQSLCNVDRDVTAIWQVDTSVGRLFAGITDAPGAAAATVGLRDGTQLRGPVVATTAESARAFVILLPAGAFLTQLEIRDDGNTVVDTVSLK